MSTDLELRQDVLEIRLPAIKISNSKSCDVNEDDSSTIQVEKDEEECSTPTSPEYLIPRILSCPPAPKKPRQDGRPSCRRRLELQFFEIVAREELECFFRSSFDQLVAGSNNRKRHR